MMYHAKHNCPFLRVALLRAQLEKAWDKRDEQVVAHLSHLIDQMQLSFWKNRPPHG